MVCNLLDGLEGDVLFSLLNSIQVRLLYSKSQGEFSLGSFAPELLQFLGKILL